MDRYRDMEMIEDDKEVILKDTVTVKQEYESKRQIDNKSSYNKELANNIYVFCPLINKGIMFYDQSPDGPLAKFAGSLPEGKFWSSGEITVDWDENINGPKQNNLVVNDDISYVVNVCDEQVKTSDDSSKTLISATIMVSERNFYNLLLQLEHPILHPDNNYKVLNLNSKIRYLNNYINDESNNNILSNDVNNLKDKISFDDVSNNFNL